MAYLTFRGGAPDIVAYALIGYALLQGLLLLRILSWVREEPFAPSYCAFTFGATALPAAATRMVEHGDEGAVAMPAPWVFGVANIVVLLITIGTIQFLMQGHLLPPPAIAPSPRTRHDDIR